MVNTEPKPQIRQNTKEISSAFSSIAMLRVKTVSNKRNTVLQIDIIALHNTSEGLCKVDETYLRQSGK